MSAAQSFELKQVKQSIMRDSRFQEELGEKAPNESVLTATLSGKSVDDADMLPGRRLAVIPPLPISPRRPSVILTRPAAPDPVPATAPVQLQQRQQVSKAPDVSVSAKRFWCLNSGILVGVLMSTMALFSVTTCLHNIANEFKALVSVTWVLLAYALAECCFGLVFSRVSDIVGRLRAWLCALVIFLLASLAASFSASLLQLVLARAIQGIGGSGLYHVSLAVVQETCPEGWHSFATGAQVVVFAIGCFLGPLLGGVFTQYASWRLIFWMNGPLSLISLVFVLIAWPPRAQRARFRRTTWKCFDYAGSALLISTIFLFIFSLQNVGLSVDAAAWASPLFLAPFVVSVCLSIVLFILEHRATRGQTEARPSPVAVFPLQLVRTRRFASAAVTALLLGFPILTLLFIVPLRSELVSGKSTTTSALMLLPGIGAAAVSSAASVKINWRHDQLYKTAITGPLLVTLGCGLLTTVHGAGDDAKLLGFLVLVGVGAGMSMTSGAVATGFFLLPASYVPAIGMFSTLRLFGGCIGVAAFSILLHNQILNIFPFPITPEMLAMLSDSKSAIPINLELFMSMGVDGAFNAATKVCAAMAGAASLSAACAFAFPKHSEDEGAEEAAAAPTVRDAEEGAVQQSQETRETQESQEMRDMRELFERRERHERIMLARRGGREDRSWIWAQNVLPAEIRNA